MYVCEQRNKKKQFRIHFVRFCEPFMLISHKSIQVLPIFECKRNWMCWVHLHNGKYANGKMTIIFLFLSFRRIRLWKWPKSGTRKKNAWRIRWLHSMTLTRHTIPIYAKCTKLYNNNNHEPSLLTQPQKKKTKSLSISMKILFFHYSQSQVISSNWIWKFRHLCELYEIRLWLWSEMCARRQSVCALFVHFAISFVHCLLYAHELNQWTDSQNCN